MAREKITRYQHVQDILDQATVGAHPGHFGNGRFWDKPLQEFLQIGPIAGVDLIAAPGPGRGARSGVVLALKGEPPSALAYFLECHPIDLPSRRLTLLSSKSGLMTIVPTSQWI